MLVTPGREPAFPAGLEEPFTRRQTEILLKTAQQRQEMLLLEVHHRIANTLQVISSIVMMKLRTVRSEESRMLLLDMHRRLVSVAVVQSQLCQPGPAEGIEFRSYLEQLCENLVVSMTAGEQAITVRATSTDGAVKSEDAVSFGLIITELVINSLKHGYPNGRKGEICVDFAIDGPDWRLCVSDNGVGRPLKPAGPGGVGTRVIASVARHLNARVEIVTGDSGMAVIVTNAGAET